MSVVRSTELIPGPWTYADLAQLPDDGKRYEIIDGVLLVNASPVPDHQEVQLELWRLLRDAAPPALRVLAAPLDVVLADDTVVQPDVLVGRREDYTRTNLLAVPLLAVEVLSPSTSTVDRNLKKDRYERAGIPSYWLIDPATLVLTVHELVDGSYAEVAAVDPDTTWHAQRPFPVATTPGDLLS
jgi:Uma2 family endonuclease